jgi:hypothetical protein
MYIIIAAWGGVFLGVCLGLLLARAILKEIRSGKTI